MFKLSAPIPKSNPEKFFVVCGASMYGVRTQEPSRVSELCFCWFPVILKTSHILLKTSHFLPKPHILCEVFVGKCEVFGSVPGFLEPREMNKNTF